MDQVRVVADQPASHAERVAAAADRRTSAGLRMLEQCFATARSTGSAMAVCFLDVDGLKAVNDTGGHSAGHRVLGRVADVIDAHLGCDDTLRRYGGDDSVSSLIGPAAADVGETIAAIAAVSREATT